MSQLIISFRRLRWRLRFSPLLILIALLLVWPAIMLFMGIFRTAPPGSAGDWSMQSFSNLLHKPGILPATLNSLWLAIATTLPALVLATLLAYLSQCSTLIMRRLITPAMMIIFATPSLFYALAFSLLANRYNGYLNDLWNALFSRQTPLLDIESWSGLIGVTLLRATAFTYLFIAPALRGLDNAHDDASLVSGRGKVATFLRISLPMLFPALTGAVILCFVAGLHAFDAPLILGEPAGIRVIATEIYNMLVNSYPPAYAEASLISVILVLLVAFLCLIQTRVMGRRSYITVTGKRAVKPLQSLGLWQLPASLLVATFLIIAVVVPFLALIYGALQPYPGIYGQLSMLHFDRVFSRPEVWHALVTTLQLSLVVGGIAMLLAVTITLTARRLSSMSYAWVRFATLLPYAMPGIVAALAVTWAWINLPGFRQLYGTVWMMMLAFVVVVMPFAMQAAGASVGQLAHDLDDAARISGASPLRRALQITGPLILPGFLSGWFFVAIIIAGNLDIPLLLGSPTLSTIASQTYLLQSQGQIGDAAALLVGTLLSLMMIALLALSIKALISHFLARHKPHHPESSGWHSQETETL